MCVRVTLASVRVCMLYKFISNSLTMLVRRVRALARMAKTNFDRARNWAHSVANAQAPARHGRAERQVGRSAHARLYRVSLTTVASPISFVCAARCFACVACVRSRRRSRSIRSGRLYGRQQCCLKRMGFGRRWYLVCAGEGMRCCCCCWRKANGVVDGGRAHNGCSIGGEQNQN